MLRYKCLVLDHDDTMVRSTPEINYPSFLLTLAHLRPGVEMSLTAFLEACFAPGFHALCRDMLGFSDAEMDYEFEAWKAYVRTHAPAVYEGMAEVVCRQKREGGLVCVVSHSGTENIRRDYRDACGLEPDSIFGWELGEEKRKPHPYPLREIMRLYGLKPAEMLMVDDLKPGYDMARACGVPFACAGWSYEIPAIAAYMRKNCDVYLPSVEALQTLLFS